ncbi:hypothetical protein TEMA_23470 [Terrisporobacter mayombei]|uniref:Helicase/UvrB N-terminal domain-containing protein n=2 Tax=Terrisporobacter mayombei TaxID=1541 RepID=A0ABY9Q214_9FIRM|nr:hypothetical protein TEMA_23470 [Terrisporobacter mayombei]
MLARGEKIVIIKSELSIITIKELFESNVTQIETLKKTREEGNDKALVVAVTGIGKTYLTDFDSKEFKTVLFIAHREKILKTSL